MPGAQPCYPLTPLQLRKAHDLDWQCCSRLFNLPLRVCSTQEQDNVESVISEDDFNKFLENIQKDWERWVGVLQVFFDETESEKGWRLRVHPNYPLTKLYIPKRDQKVPIGWTASCPQSGPTAHLYKRSPCEMDGYMGGIISLANQAQSKLQVIKDREGPKTWKVYITQVNLSAGEEVFWRYGGAVLGTAEQWSLTCCREIPAISSIPRGPRLPASRATFPKAKTTCLLCGHDLTSKSKTREQPSNFKGHYARCHLSYFSNEEPVDWNGAMFELEIFHRVISGLKSKKYAVRFCSAPGLEGTNGSQDEKFAHFKTVFNKFRQLDVLLLKGDKVPQDPEDLLPEPVTTWSSDLKIRPNNSSFAYVNAKAENEAIEKIAEERIYNIINHSY